jgi:hypothetical protein
VEFRQRYTLERVSGFLHSFIPGAAAGHHGLYDLPVQTGPFITRDSGLLVPFVAFLRRSCQSSFTRRRGRVKAERSEPARVALRRLRCRVSQEFNGEGSAAPTREFVRCCIS